jgi:hypothetical protein
MSNKVVLNFSKLKLASKPDMKHKKKSNENKKCLKGLVLNSVAGKARIYVLHSKVKFFSSFRTEH